MSPRPLTIRLRTAGARMLALMALLVAAVALTPTAASAAPTYFAGTDPAGDGNGPPYDVLSGNATYDGATGTFAISFTTAASVVGTYGGVVGYTGTRVGDECDYSAADGSSIGWGYVVSKNGGTQLAWQLTGTDTFDLGTATRVGTKTSFAFGPNPGLKGLNPTCFLIQVRQLSEQDEGADTGDDFTMFVTDAPAPGTPATDDKAPVKAGITPPPPVTTDQPDADRDGIADSADACPTVPGASTTGCPTMPAAQEFRLGARRVVVDRLVARTAAVCPASVTAVVTAKGKRVGKGKLMVATRGSFCHVTGVIALKHTAKKVRIVGKAVGMGSIAKSLRR